MEKQEKDAEKSDDDGLHVNPCELRIPIANLKNLSKIATSSPGISATIGRRVMVEVSAGRPLLEDEHLGCSLWITGPAGPEIRENRENVF